MSKLTLELNIDLETLVEAMEDQLTDKKYAQLWNRLYSGMTEDLFMDLAEITLVYIKILHNQEKGVPPELLERKRNLEQYWGYLNYLKAKNGTTRPEEYL